MKPTRIVELVIQDDNQELAIDAISLVSAPAIEQDFVYFGKEKSNLTLAKVDEEKRMLISPALIPNKNIIRYDANTDSEYYVWFSKETVRKASELYLKHNNHHKATYEHQERVSGVLTVESWIIEDPKMDKANIYGFQLKKGTWMVKMKIDNEELWQDIKSKKIKGLSIEGYFTDKFEAMQKKQPTTEQILSALNKLIRENKTELKTEKIELGMMDDIASKVKEARKFMEVAEGKGLSSLKATIKKVENDFIKGYRASSDGIDLIEKIEKQLKELGVATPSELKGYDNLLKSWQNIADKWIDQLNAGQYS
jgi:hypothetical protein